MHSDLVSNLLAKCWTNEHSIWKLYIRTTGWRNNVKKMIEVINSGNFSVQLWKESLKRIQTCTGFEPVPLRYRCSSLPIDLTSLLEAGRDSRYCRDWLAVPRDSDDIREVDCAGSRDENSLYIMIHLPTKKCLLSDNRKTIRRKLIIRLITFLLGFINGVIIRKLAIL